MITAFNKVHKQITSVEHAFMLKPASEWVINPIIPNRSELDVTPTEYWIYEEDTTILRVMTDAERDTDANRVLVAKKQKIAELSGACEHDITRGFLSSALGVPHWYDSSAYDQLNLVSSLSITAPTIENPEGTSIFYACRANLGEDKEYVAHTYMQLKQVASDQAKTRIEHLQIFARVKAEVLESTCVSQVQAIKWEE